LNTIIEESNRYDTWDEPEWGFPKGRRNFQEKDYECAIREFQEETGFDTRKLRIVENLMPYEELFTGSNYKSYKHKYFVSFMQFNDTLSMGNFEPSEVSKMEWKSYDDCVQCMRPYNLEKKKLITNINNCLTKYKLLS
jgi:8-oxo-dGTP pyrophosphatase MutT (NUDIX family)